MNFQFAFLPITVVCFCAQVGEDYLILLPECLPFLSELLEESSADALLDATRQLVQFVETLSGEQLDSYLL